MKFEHTLKIDSLTVICSSVKPEVSISRLRGIIEKFRTLHFDERDKCDERGTVREASRKDEMRFDAIVNVLSLLEREVMRVAERAQDSGRYTSHVVLGNNNVNEVMVMRMSTVDT